MTLKTITYDADQKPLTDAEILELAAKNSVEPSGPGAGCYLMGREDVLEFAMAIEARANVPEWQTIPGLEDLLERTRLYLNSLDSADTNSLERELAAAHAYAADTRGRLDTCPSCGGPADNGHDRELPPNVYDCTKCAAKINTSEGE